VQSNDPAASQLVLLVINAGAATDDQMGDTDTVSALLATAAAEVTNTNYARIDLDDTDLSAISPDDTNNRLDLDIPDQTWSSIAAGDSWTDIVIAYDPTGSSADSALIPLTCHDFAVTPDGSDITAQIAAAGFYRAS